MGWSLVFVLYSGVFFLVLMVDDPEPVELSLYGLSFPAGIIGLGSLLMASCIIWAPRRRSFASLLLTTWLSGSVAYLVSLISAVLLLTLSDRFVIVDMSPTGYDPGFGNIAGAMVSIVSWSTLINVLIGILFSWLAHKKGEKWFRFEE